MTRPDAPPEDQINAGLDALDAGDPGAAFEFFTRAMASDDAAVAGRAALGASEACFRLGRDEEAIELLRSVVTTDDRALRFQALRRLAAALVQSGDLYGALDAYRAAEDVAPDAATRAHVAGRIAWITQETGGSRRSVRSAFARARGELRFAWVIRALLLVTAAVSITAFFSADLWLSIALVKMDAGRDVLSAEPWRLLTVALVHGAPLEAGAGAIQTTAIHLLFNLFALDLGAQLVFRLYGVRRMLLWYLFGVAAASLASAIWLPNVVSVGASGGVFALFGVALGAEWAHRPLVERGVRAALGQMSGLIVINLLLGFGLNLAGGGIDNAAHLGGLLCGLLLGVIVAPTRAESLRQRWGGAPTIGGIDERLLLAGVAGILALIFFNWTLLAELRATLPL